MKKIGEGYFYNVYDLDNGLVRKVIKSRLDRFFTVCRLCFFVPHIVWSEFKDTERARLIIESSYKRLQETARDFSILGNVSFINETDYEQDKVIIVKEVLKKMSLDQQKEIVDLFVENIFQCWRQGFSERVFNFTINNGIDSNGKVILADFNEITFEKSEVLKRIHNKRWLKSYSCRFGLSFSPELKTYYKNSMDECMTEENLNKFWRTGLYQYPKLKKNRFFTQQLAKIKQGCHCCVPAPFGASESDV